MDILIFEKRMNTTILLSMFNKLVFLKCMSIIYIYIYEY